MSIDYEVEYDNRARVPEHPDIFARWQREGAAYRAATHNVKLAIPYGPSMRQTVDLFPAKDDDKAPFAMFIHGGWWRSLDPSMFSQVAAGPNARGISVAVAGYDLCPNVSIADIIVQMRNACLMLWRKRRQRIFIYGHSAGGHLAACMLATDCPAFDVSLPANLVIAAYAISGLFDLGPLIGTSINKAMGLDEESAKAASPLFWQAPARLSLDAVVGENESAEFFRQSRTIVDLWGKAGVATRFGIVPGANHFTAIAPLAEANSPMVLRLKQLAGR